VPARGAWSDTVPLQWCRPPSSSHTSSAWWKLIGSLHCPQRVFPSRTRLVSRVSSRAASRYSSSVILSLVIALLCRNCEQLDWGFTSVCFRTWYGILSLGKLPD
jgi:hypothetical protein